MIHMFSFLQHRGFCSHKNEKILLVQCMVTKKIIITIKKRFLNERNETTRHYN